MKEMNNNIYWLFDYVVVDMMPITWLASPSLSTISNRPHHGLQIDKLANTINMLVQEGHLFVANDDNNSLMLNANEIKLILTKNANKENEHLYYGLTSQGGQYWESLAKPNWDFYISVSYDGVATTNYVCTDEINLKHFVSLELSGYVNLESYSASISTIFDIVTPWQATYWKKINVGNRCVLTDNTEDLNIHFIPRYRLPVVEQKWLQKVDQWYKFPYPIT